MLFFSTPLPYFCASSCWKVMYQQEPDVIWVIYKENLVFFFFIWKLWIIIKSTIKCYFVLHIVALPVVCYFVSLQCTFGMFVVSEYFLYMFFLLLCFSSVFLVVIALLLMWRGPVNELILKIPSSWLMVCI